MSCARSSLILFSFSSFLANFNGIMEKFRRKNSSFIHLFKSKIRIKILTVIVERVVTMRVGMRMGFDYFCIHILTLESNLVRFHFLFLLIRVRVIFFLVYRRDFDFLINIGHFNLFPDARVLNRSVTTVTHHILTVGQKVVFPCSH